MKQTRKVLTLAISQALMCSAGAISAAYIDGNCELREIIEAANTDAVDAIGFLIAVDDSGYALAGWH